MKLKELLMLPVEVADRGVRMARSTKCPPFIA